MEAESFPRGRLPREAGAPSGAPSTRPQSLFGAKREGPEGDASAPREKRSASAGGKVAAKKGSKAGSGDADAVGGAAVKYAEELSTKVRRRPKSPSEGGNCTSLCARHCSLRFTLRTAVPCCIDSHPQTLIPQLPTPPHPTPSACALACRCSRACAVSPLAT